MLFVHLCAVRVMIRIRNAVIAQPTGNLIINEHANAYEQIIFKLHKQKNQNCTK